MYNKATNILKYEGENRATTENVAIATQSHNVMDRTIILTNSVTMATCPIVAMLFLPIIKAH